MGLSAPLSSAGTSGTGFGAQTSSTPTLTNTGVSSANTYPGGTQTSQPPQWMPPMGGSSNGLGNLFGASWYPPGLGSTFAPGNTPVNPVNPGSFGSSIMSGLGNLMNSIWKPAVNYAPGTEPWNQPGYVMPMSTMTTTSANMGYPSGMGTPQLGGGVSALNPALNYPGALFGGTYNPAPMQSLQQAMGIAQPTQAMTPPPPPPPINPVTSTPAVDLTPGTNFVPGTLGGGLWTPEQMKAMFG